MDRKEAVRIVTVHGMLSLKMTALVNGHAHTLLEGEVHHIVDGGELLVAQTIEDLIDLVLVKQRR